MHVKRSNLEVDEPLLKEVSRLAWEGTYSATVHRALEEFARRARTRQILDLRGSGAWEGDLSEMRGERS